MDDQPFDPEDFLFDEARFLAGAPRAPRSAFTFDAPAQVVGRSGKAKALRLKIAQQICAMIDADVQAKGDLQASADQVDELYLGREVQSLEPLWDDAPTYNAHTLGNKIEELVGYVVTPMLAGDPYFLLRAGGPHGNPVDQVQTVLHFFLHRGNWPLELDDCADLVARRGRCPMLVEYHPTRPGRAGRDVKPRFTFDAVDTQYHFVYPNSAKTLEGARCSGYLEQVRVQEIKEAQARKDYFDYEPVESGADQRLTMGNSAGDKQAGATNAVYTEDQPVDRARGLILLDLDEDGIEELYSFVVARQQQVLLLLEPHQLDQTNWADYFFKRETGRYYNESSIGTRLVGAHHFVNDTLNLTVQGATINMSPPLFAEDWALPDEVIRVRPGEVFSLEKGGTVAQGGGKLDLGMLPGLHELARRIADEASRISQNALGSSTRSTATEANQVWQGQMAGVANFARKFAYGACQTARIVLEYLYWNFDDWYPAYQDVLPELRREDFGEEYWIEVNGETPNTTPQAVQQQISLFFQALFPVLQSDPTLLQRYPSLIPGLVRAFLESTTIPGKETVLPTREEEAAQGGMMNNAQTLAIQQALAQYGPGAAVPRSDGGTVPPAGVPISLPTLGATPPGAGG